MYAVIKTGGKQYLVKEDMPLTVEKLPGEVGQTIDFDQVLLSFNEDGSKVDIGSPLLSQLKVQGVIEEQGRGKKISIIKYKPKVRYRRKGGHRQSFTKVKITTIK